MKMVSAYLRYTKLSINYHKIQNKLYILCLVIQKTIRKIYKIKGESMIEEKGLVLFNLGFIVCNEPQLCWEIFYLMSKVN